MDHFNTPNNKIFNWSQCLLCILQTSNVYVSNKILRSEIFWYMELHWIHSRKTEINDCSRRKTASNVHTKIIVLFYTYVYVYCLVYSFVYANTRETFQTNEYVLFFVVVDIGKVIERHFGCMENRGGKETTFALSQRSVHDLGFDWGSSVSLKLSFLLWYLVLAAVMVFYLSLSTFSFESV